jgi:gamma-glutamylcyclotransferase (GGCT)/AIG2-like uncharacterized protein YtfP
VLRLFFYGTLGEGMDNPAITPVRPRLGAARPATARGTLYAIPERGGWYPALVTGEGLVRGVLNTPGPAFTADDLATLDAYEAYDPADLATCEYVRREIEVAPDGGEPVLAHAYLYHRPLPATATRIEQDSFAGFLAVHGHQPLAPRDP